MRRLGGSLSSLFHDTQRLRTTLQPRPSLAALFSHEAPALMDEGNRKKSGERPREPPPPPPPVAEVLKPLVPPKKVSAACRPFTKAETER